MDSIAAAEPVKASQEEDSAAAEPITADLVSGVHSQPYLTLP